MDAVVVNPGSDQTTTGATPAADAFAAHLIPTAIVTGGKSAKSHGAEETLKIQATVCLTPVPAKEGKGGFDTWPSWIANLFDDGKIGVRVRPALSSGMGEPVGVATSLFNRRHSPLAKLAKTDRSGLLTHLNTLWAAWFSDDAASDFTSLRDLLHRAADNAPSKAFKEVLQPKSVDPTAPEAPDIVAVPRADLARRLTLARARELLEDVVSVLRPEVAKAVSEARERRKLSFDKSKVANRPWARLPTAQERAEIEAKTAAGSKAKPATAQQQAETPEMYWPFQYSKVPDGEQWSKLQDHLREERKWLDATLGEKLKPHRKAAADIAQSSQSCAASADPDVVLAALRAMRSDEKITTVDSVAAECAEKADEFQQKLDDSTAVQSASTLADYGLKVPERTKTVDVRWHSLQGIHALARIVQLVVDIEFDVPRALLESVAPALDSAVGRAINNGEQPRFLEFALDSPDYIAPRLWTLTKVVLPGAAAKVAPSCWPSTVEEWAMTASTVCSSDIACADGLLDYVNGAVDLEARFHAEDTPADKKAKRYEVISVDVVLAAEAEQKRHRRMATMEEAQQESNGILRKDDVAEAIEPSTLTTAGLQVIDRWRQAVAVDQFMTACDHANTSDRRLDANDLAIGYKIDVGVTKGPATNSSPRDWRSLTERIVRYASANPEGEGLLSLDRLADAFLPKQSSGQNQSALRAVDGAVLASGSRLLNNASKDQAGSGKHTAFTEQLIAAWDGDPIGQRTGKFVAFGGTDALPVSQSATLPKNSKIDRAPHRLRFGRSYALGMRSVLMGGVTLPIERAAILYDRGLGRGIAYPSSPLQLQRFLRHERIGAPIVATAAELLVNEHASNRKGIDSKEMIVRSPPKGSLLSSEMWRFGPAETERVLFAPGVDLSFATLHGPFDKSARQFARRAPLGGLLDVDYDSDWGGFPVFDPQGPAILEAVRGTRRSDEIPPAPPKPSEACTIIGKEKPKAANVPSGFAALRRATGEKSPSERKLQYYPDPAARYMVIALHRPDREDSYLKGGPLRIPLYPGTPSPNLAAGTPGYPDARPVVLKVKTYAGSGCLGSYDDLRKRAGIKKDEQWPSAPVVKRAGSARVITVYLAPGEDFEIEAWCVPDETQLLAWFDAPEALALLIHSAPESDLAKKYAPIAQTISDPSTSALWTARRGEASIPWSLVREAASVVYQTLLRQPVAGISSVRRLHAVHASGLPKRRPTFGSPKPPIGRPVSLVRVGSETRAAIVAGEKPWTQTSEDGARDLLIAGRATIDAETTETVELRVVGVSPRGEAFDDPRLGRSYEKRARGLWPRTKSGLEPGQILPVKAYEPGRSYMSELFGFDVAADGSADVRRSKALLARWTINRTSAGSTIDFLELTKQLAESNHSAIEAVFPDTKARRVMLSLVATSRTARFIPERLTYPTQTEAEVDEGRLFLSGDRQLELVLPATERPAALSAKSLLPAFAWTDSDRSEKTRKTKIRVRLRRPWWTSGEDERLGVVVWPPNVLHTDSQWPAIELKKGTIRRQTPMASGDGPPKLDMHKLAEKSSAAWREGFFSDADLGPGGEYVTRWGSDPIFNADDVSWFIAKDAFGDVVDLSDRIFAAPIDMIATEGSDSGALWPSAERYKPRFVENVLMPIPDADDKAKQTGPKAKEAPAAPNEAVKSPEFMMVSLVTYMPRFDADFEHWYVDIDLDTGVARDPFVRLGLVRFQPHAERHLQVSSPVAEWVQVVSYSRQVKVTRNPRNEPVAPVGAQPRDWVWVEVHSASAPDLNADAAGGCVAQADSNPPQFRATLIECRRLPTGQVSERVARLEIGKDTTKFGEISGAIVKSGEASVGTSTLWSCKLPVPFAPDDRPDLTYAVFVEEFLQAMPGSFSNEPIRQDTDINPDERTVESGTRFAVRIEVK